MSAERSVTVPYRVETQRLLLRCWSPRDAGCLREALDHSSEHLRPWIPFMKDEPRTFAQTCQWLREARAFFDRDQAWHYAVFDRSGGGLLGGNMLNPRVGEGGLELGYWTTAGLTGGGIATEATSAMIRCAFELHQVQRVEIHCAPQNLASAAIPEKLGFQHEATLKKRATNTAGELYDLMIWTLPRETYGDSPLRSLPVEAFDCAGRPIEFHEPLGEQA